MLKTTKTVQGGVILLERHPGISELKGWIFICQEKITSYQDLTYQVTYISVRTCLTIHPNLRDQCDGMVTDHCLVLISLLFSLLSMLLTFGI